MNQLTRTSLIIGFAILLHLMFAAFRWYFYIELAFLSLFILYGQIKIYFFWSGLALAIILEVFLGYNFGILSLPFTSTFLIVTALSYFFDIKLFAKSGNIFGIIVLTLFAAVVTYIFYAQSLGLAHYLYGTAPSIGRLQSMGVLVRILTGTFIAAVFLKLAFRNNA